MNVVWEFDINAYLYTLMELSTFSIQFSICCNRKYQQMYVYIEILMSIKMHSSVQLITRHNGCGIIDHISM